MTQKHKLHPFPDKSSESWSSYEIFAEVDRNETSIEIRFQLKGTLSALMLPEGYSSPKRLDNLWETTCFEFFLGQPNTPGYWEVNLSPTQHWNIYRFSGYRQGMVQEARISSIVCQQKRSPSEFFIQCQFPLELVNLATQTLELNLTAVMQKTTGDLSYWAVTHASNEADFHHRPSFTIEI